MLHVTGKDVKANHNLKSLFNDLPGRIKDKINQVRRETFIPLVRKKWGAFTPDPTIQLTLMKQEGEWNRLRYGPENWSIEAANRDFLARLDSNSPPNLRAAMGALQVSSIIVLDELLGGKEGSGIDMASAQHLSTAWASKESL